MATPAITLTLRQGALTTKVPVIAQPSPGPSGYDVFQHIEAPGPTRTELDATALRSEVSLRTFLSGLLRKDEEEVQLWILEARFPRLRALLDIPADADEFEVRL
jgi:hypothetical protein